VKTPGQVSETGGDDTALPRWQRWLLPAILGTDSVQREADGGVRLPRSARDWAVDVSLFLVACVVAGSGAVTDRRFYATAPLILSIVLAAVACLSLWLRRRHPVGVALFTVGATVLSTGAEGAAFVALFTLTIYGRPRRAVQLAVLLALAELLHAWITFSDGRLTVDAFLNSLAGAAGVLLAAAFVVVAGSFVRVRRELVLSLREQARRLESEQELRVRDAQLAERSRIAREMHDVLSHRISLLALYAGALEYNSQASPEEIARAAAVIRVNARAAQEELREVIGVLRFSGEPGDGAVSPPQPTVADLPRLIAESHNAGMELRFANALVPGSLAGSLERTIYRVVQEGLTNARKHAPGQLVDVRIDSPAGREIEVRVANRPAVGAELEPPAGTALAQPGSGTGLIGLAERARLCGGSLATCVLSDGGFELVVKLPISGPEEGLNEG
jgi:signal transduction histidine kinase